MRLASSPREKTSTTPMKPRNIGPKVDSPNVCTDDRIPLRVKNVPNIVSANVMMIRNMFQTLSMFFFSWIITECRKAVPVSHGRKDALSTGSHIQKPPQPSSTYAHCAPQRFPQVSKNHEKMVHRRVVRIHWSPSRPLISAARAKANGIVNPIYPR